MFLSKYFLILSILFTVPALNSFNGYGQSARKIEKFIRKKKVIDFDIIFSKDSVPENLNISCKGILRSSKNKQITIPGDLLSRFFRSGDVIISNAGRLTLINHHLIKYDTAVVSIQMAAVTALFKSFKIPVNYQGNLILNYSGKNGLDGKNGENGKPGIISDARATDPEMGSDGQNGMNGDAGGSFYIYLEPASLTGSHYPDLINLIIHDKTDLPLDTFKIDSSHTGLYFILNGGSGGNGGDGGHGGHGADGDQTVSFGHGHPGALGGKGGNGGNGGNGGQVIVYLNEKLESFVNRIKIINNGGKSGHGGKMGKMGARGTTSLYRDESPDKRAGREMQKGRPDLNGRDGTVGLIGPPIQTFFFKNRYPESD